jgi:hypothetical protein
MKPNQILLLVFAAIVVLFSCVGGCAGYHYGKRNCGEVVSVVHDTIYRDTTLKQIAVTHPKVISKKPNKAKVEAISRIDTIPCDTIRIIAKEIVTQLPDTCTYSDTLREANNYKIIYTTTVLGTLLDFKLQHANLKPEIREIITKVKKPLPSVYIGAIVGVNNTATDFVAAPSVAVSYKSFNGFYGYDIRGQAHMVGAYWRVFGK